MDSPRLIIHSDRDHCARALAAELGAQLRAAQQGGGVARLLLPGGQSPLALFARLAGEALDWPRLELSPSDERWVAAEDPASNLRLLREALPQAVFIDPRQGASPEAAAQAWGERLAARLPLDAVLLGMGEDGHIASLFPGMPGLGAALDPQAAPAALPGRAPVEPCERLTPNLALLLASDWLGLLVFGASKRALLEAVLADAPAVRALPVSALLRAAGARLRIHWAP